MKVYVIMGNDYPDCVMNSKDAADEYCQKLMDAQRAENIKQYGEVGKHYTPRIYWRSYEFEVDA